MLPVMQVGCVRPGAPPERDVLHPVGGGLGQARPTNNLWMRALVKLVTSWVRVPPVELDGSRPKCGVRDEAVRLNHKRDAVSNCRVATKVNLIK